ncbi:SDR family NAD(P)-dependent oxidoreductase [Aliikangiella sp. IMCC44359]|uniref:SDR family NAD(P)-dependent oxidoreductase n=1 Tax=Aliikangiella sp. IMCC44359 TaxID=3459125 RepID=UPI00403A9964
MYKNKVIWVTGASSGIGKALCVEFDRLGANLILSARDLEALQKLKELLKHQSKHYIVNFDLTETNTIPLIVEQAWSFNGKVDTLINNAGISQRSLALDTCFEVDRKVMELDYFAPVALTKSILPRLVQQKCGMIVNIVSVAGKVGSPMRSAYSAAKHALIGFMDCLRAETKQYGIRVVNVCPGFVKTNISLNALTGDLSQYNRMDHEIENGMAANEFAQLCIKHLNYKDEIIIARGLPKLGYHLHRFFPNLYHRILPKIYKRNK